MVRGRGAGVLCVVAGLGALAGAAGAAELQNPPEIPRDKDGTLQLTASLRTYQMPGQGTPVNVRVRSFQADSPLLASPTIRARPGDTVRLTFRNELDFSPAEGDTAMSTTEPHGFDVLNLHTHGLHVSPEGNSDNVLLMIYPASTPPGGMHSCEHEGHGGGPEFCKKGRFDYEYKIPADHPSGTYWYHPHKHGAVALHLGSGMAGALLVEDDKKGLESLPAVKAAKGSEKVLLLQEITYAPTGSNTNVNEVTCNAVYGFSPCTFDGQAAAATTGTPNAKLSVNGQFDATITMQAGEAQLWRVVNMTVGNTVPFCLVPESGDAPAPELYVLAADGVPVHRPVPSDKELPFRLMGPQALLDPGSDSAATGVVNNEFQFMAPGQRLDLMVKAPAKPGRYVLAQPDPNNPPSIGGLCQPGDKLKVGGKVPENQLVLYVDVVATKKKVNEDVPTQGELNKLTTPDPIITSSTKLPNTVPSEPTQGVVFGFTNGTYAPSVGGASVVNGRPFTEERVQRTLKLGEVDRWGVQSAADTHMFHIHTNSFQIFQRGQVPYAFPIWRDTALINCAPVVGSGNCAFPGGLTNPGNNNQSYGEVLQFVSQALDFTGKMVMHCHNVTHEDNGMMELVEIVK